jgi:hypothetical protein
MKPPFQTHKERRPHHRHGAATTQDDLVNKLCIFVGMTVIGHACWYLGRLLGFEFFGCFLLSGLGGILGVWLGWKVAEHFQ